MHDREPVAGQQPRPDQEIAAPKRSSRDPEVLRRRLVEWLRARMPPGSDPHVPAVATPAATGMSSETLLFEVVWREGGRQRSHPYVARVAPDPADVPVFPDYDLEAQYRVISLVAEHSRVPVPTPRWLELDPAVLGAPFFVMERVEGRVPPDVMPYPMDSWLLEATPEQQRALQDASVGVLAELHAIDLTGLDVSFLEVDAPGDTPLRRHVAHWRAYYDWVRAGRTFPLLERAFAWLEEHWPADEGDTVISWGDARIGNILYDGFTPVAVLDWEMAGLGPAGIDLGWMVFLHTFFQDITRTFGLPGMPGFMRAEDVVATYEARSGRSVGDLRFYEVYAALRHGIVMARIRDRQVAFGEEQPPDDPDDAVMHRERLEAMLA